VDKNAGSRGDASLAVFSFTSLVSSQETYQCRGIQRKMHFFFKTKLFL
jgi:hypothetical protein